MYYRHDLPYEYPEKSDQHMISVKHLRDVNCDENYPYLQKSAFFKLQRGLLHVCQYSVLPLVMWLRHGLHIHGKDKLKQHKNLLKNGLITVSNHVFMWDYICIMVAMRPRLGYFPAWQTNLEGPNGPWIRMAGGIPIPTHSMRAMVQFKKALEEAFDTKQWVHFFPEGSMWFYYPDIRPLKKAVFKYAVRCDRPVMPLCFSFRPRKGLWKLLGKSPLVDLHIGDPIYPDSTLSQPEATNRLHAQAYHVMQTMAGIEPGHPHYRAEQDLEHYEKTM